MINYYRSRLGFLIIFIFFSISLWAMGKADDSETQPVSGLDNWEHSIDISDLPPGEYNILLHAVDKAGNSGSGGPYNIYIDPSVQIPKVSISTPSRGSRAGNSLNVLGTAVDDKLIERVEIAVDEGEFSPAEGTSFWRMNIDCSAWDDGEHTIKARAWDEDQNESESVSVSFFKDTVKPVIDIISHTGGSYVTGKIALEGTVTDLNGIEKLSCSEDGGKTYNEIKLSKGTTDGQWTFSRKIDTRLHQDGSFVFWLEAVDGLGSRSKQSFLFYIDNRPPELTLIYPEAEKSVNGRIVLIGRAYDEVGISSLSYEADNGTAGEISLSPGNPVWVLPLDYGTGEKKEARINMLLTDIVGNVISGKFRIPLNLEADLPVPGVSDSVDEMIYGIMPVLTGMMKDDDGSTGKIEYSLNGGDWKSVDVSGPWSLQLDQVVAGDNRIEIRAVDSFGMVGETIRRNIRTAYPVPEIIFDSLTIDEQDEKWFPGMVIDSEIQAKLAGTVRGAGISGLEWSFNNSAPKKLVPKSGDNPDEAYFDIKLPRYAGEDRIDISVTGQDGSGTKFSAQTTFYYNSLSDPEGLYFVYPESAASDYIVLGEGDYLGGWTGGGGIKSMNLSGGEFLDVSFSGNGFRITASEEGAAEDIILTATLENGKELISKPMNIASDRTSPVIEITQPSPGSIIGEHFLLDTAASDNTALGFLKFSVDGGKTYTDLSGSDPVEVSVLHQEDGEVTVILEAGDIFGNTEIVSIPLLKDTKAPSLSFITSSFSKGAEQITVSGKVDDIDSCSKIEISFIKQETDPVIFDAVQDGNVFYLDVNLTSLGFNPEQVLVSAVDNAGNKVEQPLLLDLDFSAGMPVVDIQVPEEMSATETGFELSGLILDQEGVASVSYSLNDGAYLEAGSGNLFTVPLKLSELQDDINTVRVKAVDLNGLESEEVERKFIVSLDPPFIQINKPDLDSVVKGSVLLEGVSSDVNGIAAILISHDNGNTFQKAEGTELWTYPLDTSLLSDGITSILIRAVDNAGVSSMITTLINTDNTSPEITFSKPSDGEAVRGSLELSGRVFDNSSLKSLTAILTPLDDKESGMETVKDISSRGTIRETLDINGLSPGFYSFRAEAVDSADNTGTVSRVIEVLPEGIRPPELLAPLPGESVGPRFSVQGFLPDKASRVHLKLNDRLFKTVEVDSSGFFRCDVLQDDDYTAGWGRLSLMTDEYGSEVESESIELDYSDTGLWVTFDNLSEKQYVTDRFTIEGSAGYEQAESDPEDPEKLQPGKLEFSLDGGITFRKLRIKDGKWEFTLYSEEVPDGELNLAVRISGEDSMVYSRCSVVMDTKAPNLYLLSPEENSRQFGNLLLSGSASDDGGLTGVWLNLRDGDKDNYSTPSFIQGMYFDASALGATYFTAGLGLTFMDDNVKLQMQYGYAPETVIDPDTGYERASRFGGNVFGAKLLANLAQVPFSWLFGPEFSALSATAALGANFSYFSSNSVDSEDSWGVVLAGVVGQFELPKISFKDRRFLKYISVFWEGQLWLISSDVSPEVVLLPSVGARIGLF